MLGQHTREVLGELGFGVQEVEAMLASGAADAAPDSLGKAAP